jgi:PAS domain S-box-containing protein
VLIVANTGKLTFQSPELWVYLLGLTVLLGIALRRVLAQQNPLKDEVYMKNVAIEYVQSGVAWIRADGTVRSINQSLADTLGALPRELIKLEWYELFAAQDHAQLKEAFSQMLLIGKTTLQVHGKRMDGTYAGLELLMVAIHDHKMRFVGHHCLVVDRTRERVLEAQIAELKQSVSRQPSAAH